MTPLASGGVGEPRSTESAGQRQRPDAESLVERSIRKYRWSHRRYERKHPEIFNPIEQRRLGGDLRDAVAGIRTGAPQPRVLDLGCGSGNVSAHLLDLGVRVIAADVSPHFLSLVARRYASTGRLETLRLNGTDLAELPAGSVDMVCAYSVLHHIPDYLAMIEEIARVLAAGGVAYLDHEVNESFWDKQGCFWRLLGDVSQHRLERANRWNGSLWWNPEGKRWQRFLQPRRYVLRVRRTFNPAYPWDVEGDIHVWETDHIEWDKVEEGLTAGGCETVTRKDYLNYSSDYPDEIWRRYEDRCTNMRLVVARRTGSMRGAAG